MNLKKKDEYEFFFVCSINIKFSKINEMNFFEEENGDNFYIRTDNLENVDIPFFELNENPFYFKEIDGSVKNEGFIKDEIIDTKLNYIDDLPEVIAQNIVFTCTVGTHLNLLYLCKMMSNWAPQYNPKKFSAVIIRLLNNS